MKKRKPLVIKEVKFAPTDDPASHRKMAEVLTLLLRCNKDKVHKEAYPPDVNNTNGGEAK